MSTSDDAYDLRQATVEGMLAQVRALQAQAASDLTEIETLRIALGTSRRIGAATGVIMATLRLTEEQAFARLRQASQNSNRKLRDIADDVVFTGACPAPSDSTPTRASQHLRRPDSADQSRQGPHVADQTNEPVGG